MKRTLPEHSCHTCNLKFKYPLCPYGNAERILHTSKAEPCPYWVSIKGSSSLFGEQVRDKLERRGGEGIKELM